MLSESCINMSGSAWNQHGGSDEYNFSSAHTFWSGPDQEATWQQNSH